MGDVTDGLPVAWAAFLLLAVTAFLFLAGTGAYWLARAALGPAERMRRVRGALARQRSLAADASHELRTPLAVLAGELELASKPGRSREELAAAVATAADEVTRLERITEDLLLLARGDEDKLVTYPAPTDIGALLTQSAGRAGGRAGAAGVACRVDAPGGLVASVDPGQVRRAVDNLVDNGLRFAPPGTDITLSAGQAGSMLVIEVRDHGPGFPPDFLPHAFERFRRADRDRARGEGGAGLGLAIVRAIALAHGGRAAARNRPGGGAVVRLEIPATRSTRGQ
jgi:signal transduction histidine kinase